MPPYRLPTSWPLWRHGSPKITPPLCLPYQLPTLSHTPQRKPVKEEELTSSSHPCGSTRSFPWITDPDLSLNSMLCLSPSNSSSTQWWSISLPILSTTSLMIVIPSEGAPLTMAHLGDFNIHPEKLRLSSPHLTSHSLSRNPPLEPGTNYIIQMFCIWYRKPPNHPLHSSWI